MSKHLGAGFKLFCSHYRSISGVYRQLVINRVQFDKYLSDQSQPAPCDHRRINDFFGVEDYKLGLLPEQFTRLIGARASTQPRQSSGDPLLQLLQPLRIGASDLNRYCSCYFEYANCMLIPGNTLPSLVHLYRGDGVFLLERQERQEHTDSIDVQVGEWTCYHYFGATFQLQDRMFLIDYESLAPNKINQTILIPSFKSRITRLSSLKMGVSSGDRRVPTYSRVVWEYLGAEINRINAHRQMHLHRPDDSWIDEDIRQCLAAGSLWHGLLETG